MFKVSVIVPIYNVEKYIEQCLNSIIEQTYSNIEIICVDDCGQDSSITIIESIQKEHPSLIRIIYSEENVGLGAARDKGIVAATGDYIAFVDSDDYISPDFIERYMSSVNENQEDIIVGGYVRDEGGKYSFFLPEEDTSFVWMNVSAWTKMYRRDFLYDNSISFCGVKRYEDECFTYRVLMKKPHIQFVEYAGYFYRFNNESITKSKKKDRTIWFEEYLNTIENFIESEDYIAYVELDRNLLKYCLGSGLIANLLYNGQGCGLQRMNRLYDQMNCIMQKIDKYMYKNPYIPLKYLKSEPVKKRYATWLVLRMRRIKIDRVLFLIDSLLRF